MPTGHNKPINEMTDHELVGSAWAFGLIGSFIGLCAIWSLLHPDPTPAPMILRVFLGLVALGSFAIAAAGIRRHLRELQRRRSANPH